LGTNARNILVSLLEYNINVLIPFINGIILRIDKWYFKKNSIKTVEKVGQTLENKIIKDIFSRLNPLKKKTCLFGPEILNFDKYY